MEQAWGVLERRLRLLSGFGLLVYFVRSQGLARGLRDRLAQHLRGRQLSLDVVAAGDADHFAEHVLSALFRAPESADVGVHWLEAYTGAGLPEWDAQRRELLSRLNERRGRLEAELHAPLVLLLPAAGVAEVAQWAPDLWHIRLFTETLGCDEGAIAEAVLPSALRNDPQHLANGASPETMLAAHADIKAWARQWQEAGGALPKSTLGPADPGLQSLSIDDGNRAVMASLSLGDVDAAERIAEDLVALARWRLTHAEESGKGRARFELSSALDSLGHVAMARSQWEQALTAFEEGLGLAKHLTARADASASGWRAVTVSLENIARAHAARQDWTAALAAAKDSIRICRGLAEGTDLFGLRRRELAIALDLAGEIAFMSGLLDEAQTCFSESVELRRGMIQRWGGRLAKEGELLVALVGLAKVARERQDWTAAQRIGRECLEIGRRQFDRLPGDPQATEDLAIAVMINLDLLDTPGDAYRDEARRLVADLRQRYPKVQRYADMEAALQSSDNPA